MYTTDKLQLLIDKYHDKIAKLQESYNILQNELVDCKSKLITDNAIIDDYKATNEKLNKELQTPVTTIPALPVVN